MRHLLTYLLAASLVAPLFSASARVDAITVQIVKKFDYPGGAKYTYPQAINNRNTIAGFVPVGAGSIGFTRDTSGGFIGPLIDPDDAHMITAALGLNDSGIVCGYYFGADDYHGFFFSDGSYTTYDVPGESGTEVMGINNAGDFVGSYYDPTIVREGFISVEGRMTRINIPGGTYITPNSLNIRDEVVGLYTDGTSGEGYAFYSGGGGQLHFPINAPGAKNTFLYGINDQGLMVGGYASGSGPTRATHGLLFIAPDQFVTVDLTGSSEVVLTGINNRGFICGYFRGKDGHVHGLLARVRRNPE